MELRSLLTLLSLSGALLVGGCRGDAGGGVGRGDEDTGVVDEEELVEENAGVELDGPEQAAREIPGNGIDDDADGEIDEDA